MFPVVLALAITLDLQDTARTGGAKSRQRPACSARAGGHHG
jgi:hypothetical protein